MHALAIEVDPTAYRAVKAEALRRLCTIPALIGDILTDPSLPMTCPSAPGPRWRRTGEGRRANQHTRIDIDESGWRDLHLDAWKAGNTVGRWIGMALESWARQTEAIDK